MILGSPSSVLDLRSHIAFHGKFSFFPSRARLIPRSFIPPRCSSSVQEIQKSSSPSEDRRLSSELYASAPFPPVKVAKRVVLVRHGQSTWNAEGRIQGSSNFSVLTKKGEAQAETSRQMLIDDKFDVCFARFHFHATSRNCELGHFLLILAMLFWFRSYLGSSVH